MNRTTIRRMQLRDLTERMAQARLDVVQQTTEREAAIRLNGAAHPKSIRASRRLNWTQNAYRALVASHRRQTREDAPRDR